MKNKEGDTMLDKEIELINRNEERYDHAYNITESEFIDMCSAIYDAEEITNTREYVIPYVATTDLLAKQYATELIKELEDIEIENDADLIETICGVDEKRGIAYMHALSLFENIMHESRCKGIS